MKNLHELLVGGLRDIYYAEKMITQDLPRMAKKANSPELRKAFEKHLGETEQQIKRLERCFELLSMSARGKKCPAIEGLSEEGKEIMEEAKTPEVLDSGLIMSGHKVEHYEIGSYITLSGYAELLGYTEISSLLRENLAEEQKTAEALTALGEELDPKSI